MDTLLLPFSPRFIVLTICDVVTALLLGIGIVDRKVLDLILIPLIIFAPDGAWHSRPHPKESCGSAQLSDLGAFAFPAGRDQAGDASVLLREREGWHAVQPRHPRGDLSAGEDGARQAPVRHTGGCLS